MMDWQTAQFFQINKDSITCTLCPHLCELKHHHQLGQCHVRRKTDKYLETAAFATSLQHLDAIERKPLYHYKPSSKVLTLASPGCSFRCLYCQNYRISQYGRSEDVPWQAKTADINQIITYAIQHQAAIGFSYAEPSLNAELTLELAKVAKPHLIDIIWKTNGFITPSAANKIIPCLAAVNIDLKSLNPKKHRSLTGADVASVLEIITLFYKAGIWIEISTPVIPKINADLYELKKIAEFIYAIDPSIPWHLGRFNPDHKLRNLPPTSTAMLKQGREMAFEVGLKHVYIERSLGIEARTTYCESCSHKLITRDIWALKVNHLIKGACPRCKTPLKGRW